MAIALKKWNFPHLWLLRVAAFLFVLIVMLAGGVYLFGESMLRSYLQGSGSARIGRTFAVEGPLHITWRWNTRVHAEKIRLGNVEGAKEPYMLEIEKLDFAIRPLKLLWGNMELPFVTADGVKIVYDKKDDGIANWDLPLFSKGDVVTGAVTPNDRYDFPLIGLMTINNAQLIYRDVPRALDLDLKLDSAEAEGGEGKQGFKVTGTGTLQGNKFEVGADGGSLNLLRDTSKKFPLNAEVKMGGTVISFKGSLQDPVNMQGIQGALEVKGPNMADLFYLTSIPLPPTPPYTLLGALDKEGDVWKYEAFKGKVGDSDLAGDLEYRMRDDRGFMTAKLGSKRVDLDDLGGFIGMAPGTGAGETASAEQKAKAAKEEASVFALPKTPINLERLRASDMDVTWKADKLNAPGWPFNGFDVHVTLERGLLKIDPMNLQLADGSAQGTLEFDGSKDVPQVKTSLDLKRLSLARFFGNTRFDDLTKGHFGGHIELAGPGKSLADILAASDGSIVMMMSGGRMSLLLIEASDLDAGEAIPLFLGKDKAADIRCAVADFNVKQGILTSKLFILDTSDSKLEGDVVVNMRNETIDAEFDAEPKDVSILSVQSPIIIKGRLKSPSITLSKEAGVRAAVAGALGAVLTPVAAVLPFVELGTAEDANCGALLKVAKKDAQ